MNTSPPTRLSLPLWNDTFAAPVLPTTRAEMLARGWDAVDVLFVTGDAYVDHPSFAMAILGRVLEAAGFRVAILSQPDWHTCEPWRQFGRPRLFFAVSAGNMDSLINHYTANKKLRNDDAYSPGGRIGLRPDRATLPYCHRCREAFSGVPVIAGGVEASLRRLAHYDYWSDTVRRSILLDSKADLVGYGMGENGIVEIAKRLAAGQTVKDLRDMRGVAYVLGARESELLTRSVSEGSQHPSLTLRVSNSESVSEGPQHPSLTIRVSSETVLLPSYEQVKSDKHAFVEATRLIHIHTNPHNAQTLVQFHDRRRGRQSAGLAHFRSGDGRHLRPAVHPPAAPVLHRTDPRLRNDQGFGHGHARLFRRLHLLLDHRAPGPDHPVALAGIGLEGSPQDGGRPRIQGHDQRRRRPHREHVPDALYPPRGRGEMQTALLRPSDNLQAARHRSRPADRAASPCPHRAGHSQSAGFQRHSHGFGPASPEYVRELAAHHVGGRLKVAPEHTDKNVLALMKKPDIDNFGQFAEQFEKESSQAGKPKQFLVPYFIASHPGCDLPAMIDLALYLKRNGYRPDQVQDFIPAPFDIATCMYYTGIDPFTKQEVQVARKMHDRKLQRALMQFFKPENWFTVREALIQAGRQDLIGSGCDCLIAAQPPKEAIEVRRRRANDADHYHTVANPAKGEKPGERGLPNKGYRPGRKSAKKRKRNDGRPAGDS